MGKCSEGGGGIEYGGGGGIYRGRVNLDKKNANITNGKFNQNLTRGNCSNLGGKVRGVRREFKKG